MNLVTTIETLKAAKNTKGTYAKVLEIAQAVTEQKTIGFMQTKAFPALSFEQKVICTLCDLLSLSIELPASLRKPMVSEIEKAMRLVEYKS